MPEKFPGMWKNSVRSCWCHNIIIVSIINLHLVLLPHEELSVCVFKKLGHKIQLFKSWGQDGLCLVSSVWWWGERHHSAVITSALWKAGPDWPLLSEKHIVCLCELFFRFCSRFDLLSHQVIETFLRGTCSLGIGVKSMPSEPSNQMQSAPRALLFAQGCYFSQRMMSHP